MNIGQIPAKWARMTPDNEAIIDSTTGRRITFGDLDRHVRKLANALLGLGLQKGDRVGVLSMNSIEYCALYFACGRAGLIAQPMNWRLSPPELKKIIDNGSVMPMIKAALAPLGAVFGNTLDDRRHCIRAPNMLAPNRTRAMPPSVFNKPGIS